MLLHLKILFMRSCEKNGCCINQSRHSLAPLEELQELHAGTIFRCVVLPPWLTGTKWSLVNLSPLRIVLPQYAHVNFSSSTHAAYKGRVSLLCSVLPTAYIIALFAIISVTSSPFLIYSILGEHIYICLVSPQNAQTLLTDPSTWRTTHGLYFPYIRLVFLLIAKCPPIQLLFYGQP